jgi:beta-glucanase (GH16 family)
MTKNYLLLITISWLFVQCNTSSEKPRRTAAKEKIDLSEGRKLVWSDEFEVDGLPDSTKWSYDIGDGCPRMCGWGNNEAQYYTEKDSDNVRIENGHLIIEARREDMGKRKYTSARLVTKNKGDWKYGLIEVRAKLPSGVGTWPAIWMLPTKKEYGGWPKSGEIDIMEHVGYSVDSIFGTVHTQTYNHIKGTQKGGAIIINDSEEAFHTYGINWTDDEMQFFVDDEIYFTFRDDKATSDEWPFDQAFHLILNVAVGGNWGGRKGIDNDIFPQKMEVDYVRVYL